MVDGAAGRGGSRGGRRRHTAMLEYDDSAFYYFTLTVLGFYILPGTYYLVFNQIMPALRPRDDPINRPRTEVSPKRALASSV
jgi:hypothetical protein